MSTTEEISHMVDERGMAMYRVRQQTVGHNIKVLDHGYIKVIDFLGDDASIVEAARMSTGRGFFSWEPYVRCKACDACFFTEEEGRGLDCSVRADHGHAWEKYPQGDMGLLDTLWRKKHATPFEMGSIIFEVQAPLMVFREWQRHRTQKYNEFSARYSEMPNLHYVPSADRLKAIASANKQASSLDDHLGEEVDLAAYLNDIDREQQEIYETYQTLLKNGVPKEVARINTPVARYSKMRAKTDLRNWLAFLNLRARPDAQWEIRQYAGIVADLTRQLFPRTFGLFEEYDLYGASFSRTELRAMRQMLTSKHNLDEVCKELGITGRKKAEFEAKIRRGGEEIL